MINSKHKGKHLLTILLLIQATVLLGQHHQGVSFTLNQPLPVGHHLYEASEFIELNPGFEFTASNTNNSFEGIINPYMIIPPAEGEIGGPLAGDNGVVGSIAGSASVLDNGVFSYSFSIAVPPGRAGMTPEVSLNYNSNGPNGTVGLGWSIGSLSMISRTSPTYYHSANHIALAGGEALSSELVLDGVRLIAQGNNEYRKEYDDFSQIKEISENGWTRYQVKTKSGLIYEYGRTHNSYQIARNFVPPTTSKTFSYYLSSVKDLYENSINYSYNHNWTTGENYLEKITYLDNEILFCYDNAAGKSVTHMGFTLPMHIECKKILKEIHCKHKSEVVRKYVLDYEERYVAGDEENVIYLLRSVEEIAANEQINKTRFTWEEEIDYAYKSKPIMYKLPVSVQNSDDFTMIYGNFYGKTTMDAMVFYQKRTGRFLLEGKGDSLIFRGGHYEKDTIIRETRYNIEKDEQITLDINGDGFDDFIYYEVRINNPENTGDNRLILYININDGAGGFFEYRKEEIGTYIQVIPGDFNGDGRADILLRNYYGVLQLFLSDPDYADQGHLDEKYFYHDGIYLPHSFDVFPGHFMGDHRTQLLARGKRYPGTPEEQWEQFVYRIKKRSGYEDEYQGERYNINEGIDLDPYSCDFMLLGDLNGDGKSDIVKGSITSNVGNSSYFVHHIETETYQSYRDDFEDYKTITITSIPVDKSYMVSNGISQTLIDESSKKMFCADFNGDGRCDILIQCNLLYARWEYNQYIITRTDPLTIILYANKSGTSFSKKVIKGTGTLYPDCIPFDFNGDGASELMYAKIKYGMIPRYEFSTDSYRITLVTNGLGRATQVKYKFLSDSTIYTPSTDTTSYPYAPLTTPYPAVSELIVDNGVGNDTIRYRYEGGLVHMRGHGFLGFKRRIITNLTKDVREVIDCRLYDEAPFLLPQQTHSYQNSSGILLNKTVTNYKLTNTTGKLNYFVALKDRTEYNYDNFAGLGIYSSSKYTIDDYDNFGNALKTTQKYYKGTDSLVHTTTSQNTYNNYTEGKWILGRLSRTKTTYETAGAAPIDKRVAFVYYTEGLHDGMLRKEITEPDSDKPVTKEYIYDSYGNITVSKISAPGMQTRIDSSFYDHNDPNPKGRFLTKRINAEGHVEEKVFDTKSGNVTTITDPNGNVTRLFYDSFGRHVRTLTPDGNQTVSALRWASDNDDYAPTDSRYYVWSQSSGSLPVRTYYDCAGKELRTVSFNFSGAAVIVDTKYDAKGRVVRKSEPYYPGSDSIYYSKLEYDTLWRVSKTIAPSGAETKFSYSGLTTTVKNAHLNESKKTVNPQGWLVETEDALGGKIIHSYFSDGTLHTTKVKNYEATARTYNYDIFGNMISYHDASQGAKKYAYNPFGELIYDVNAQNDTTFYTQYDKLSRLREMRTPDDTVTWVYDQQKIGVLDSVYGSKHRMAYTYDNLLRVLSVKETIENEMFTTSYSYDQYNRVDELTYPSGYAIKNMYNEYGYQNKILERSTSKVLWQAMEANARNQITKIKLGNNITQNLYYDPITGLIREEVANGLQDNLYDWDYLRNLTFRSTFDRKEETFEYDPLNRLEKIYHDNELKQSITYDALGNITYKSDVGDYQYNDSNNPYKLTAINDNSALISHDNQRVDYNYFNKVSRVAEHDPRWPSRIKRQLDLSYGIDKQRIKQVTIDRTNFSTKEKYYVGGIYEKENNQLAITKTHYITAPTGLVAILEYKSGGGSSIVIDSLIVGGNISIADTLDGIALPPEPLSSYRLLYVLTDHLGSIQVLASENGMLIEELSYDVWGMRRDPITLEAYLGSDSQTPLGFTGHEHLDLFALVNMNGRMYDPVLGRFLSPDPILQYPNYTQGLNPYAYCLNNPLRHTDPTGHFTISNSAGWKIFGTIGAALTIMIAPYSIFAASVVSGILQYCTASTLKATPKQAIAQGFSSAGLTFLSHFAVSKIGQIFDKGLPEFANEVGRALAHGTFNGGLRVVQGGRFEHGFMSGMVSSLGGSMLQNRSMSAGSQVALSAVLGGTAEALGGGKFANGAITGAFVMLFNHLSYPPQRGNYTPESLTDEQIEQLTEKVKAMLEKNRKAYANPDLEAPNPVRISEKNGIDFTIDGISFEGVKGFRHQNYGARNVEIKVGSETYYVDIVYSPNSQNNIVTIVEITGKTDYTIGGRILFRQNDKTQNQYLLQIEFKSKEDRMKFYNYATGVTN